MLDPKHLLEICQEAQRVENWVRSLPRAFAQDANYLSLAPGDTAREDELSAAQQCAEGLLQKAKAELKENSVVEDWNAGISRLLLADLVIQIRIRASLGIINADFAMLCFESWNVSFEAARRISGQIRSVHSSSRQNSLPLIEELYKRSGARLIEATKIWVSNSVENSCAEVIINGFMGLSSLEDYPVVNSAMKGIMQFVKSKMDFLTDTPRNQQLLVRIANYILDRASKHINRLINVLKDVSSDGEDKEATLVLFFIKHLIQLVHLAPKNSFDSISFINKLLEMFNAAEKSPRCVEFYFTRVSPLLSKWIDLISTSSSDSGEIKSRTFSCLHSFKSLTWCYIFLRSKHVLSLPFQGSEQMAVLDIINHVLSPELLDYVMEIDVLPHAHKILEMLTSSIASFLLEAPPDVLKRMFNYLIIKFIDSDEPKLSLFVLRCFYRFFQRCSAKCCDEFIQNFECLLERCKLHQRMKILILLASIWTVKVRFYHVLL